MKKTSHIYSVAELTSTLREVVETQFPFIWVRGGVSNLSRPSSGHLYFSLCDNEAALPVVMFRPFRKGERTSSMYKELIDYETGEVSGPMLVPWLYDGAEVLVYGRLSIYPPRGTYQLLAESVEDLGVGKAFLEFEALKRKLASEGLFDASRKRPLPANPAKVAVVTSLKGAALQDFLRIGQERGFGAKVRIFPALVQGEGAPVEIVTALRRCLESGWPEVIVLIRGGGAAEDLGAFNNESVARAIGAASIPVLSGVGHEINTTLADLVADERAATPSHAAQMLWPDRRIFFQELDELESRLVLSYDRLIDVLDSQLNSLSRDLNWLSPAEQLGREILSVGELEKKLSTALKYFFSGCEDHITYFLGRLERFLSMERLDLLEKDLHSLTIRLEQETKSILSSAQAKLSILEAHLTAADPDEPLRRGFARVNLKRTGRLLLDAQAARAGDKLDIFLQKGQLEAEVVSIARVLTSGEEERP